MSRSPLRPDGEVARILRDLPRARPQEIPLEEVVERWHRRDRGALLLGALALATGLIALMLLPPVRPEPPVHLDLRVVDVAGEEAPAADEEILMAEWSGVPGGTAGP